MGCSWLLTVVDREPSEARKWIQEQANDQGDLSQIQSTVGVARVRPGVAYLHWYHCTPCQMLDILSAVFQGCSSYNIIVFALQDQ